MTSKLIFAHPPEGPDHDFRSNRLGCQFERQMFELIEWSGDGRPAQVRQVNTGEEMTLPDGVNLRVTFRSINTKSGRRRMTPRTLKLIAIDSTTGYARVQHPTTRRELLVSQERLCVV